MATVIESGIGQVNYGKQSAKGTIAVAATTTVGYNRIKHVGGGFRDGKQLASEEYSDGNRFGSPTTFTNFVGGAVGTVMLQAQPENIGLFYAQILGSDVVTGASDPYTHTITGSNTGGTWGTWWQKLGSAVGPERQAFWDSKISRLVDNAPRERNVRHLELDVAALNAAQVFTTDPGKTEDTSDPYLATESQGAMTFDGTVIAEVSDSICEVNTGITPFFGDAITPAQLIEGKGSITRSFSSIVTDETLLKYHKAIYNTASPSAGTVPVKDVFYANISQVTTRSATRTATVTTPRVAIDPTEFPAMTPLPEGGELAIPFGGRALKSGATPPLTVIVLSADATTYA